MPRATYHLPHATQNNKHLPPTQKPWTPLMKNAESVVWATIKIVHFQLKFYEILYTSRLGISSNCISNIPRNQPDPNNLTWPSLCSFLGVYLFVARASARPVPVHGCMCRESRAKESERISQRMSTRSAQTDLYIYISRYMLDAYNATRFLIFFLSS